MKTFKSGLAFYKEFSSLIDRHAMKAAQVFEAMANEGRRDHLELLSGNVTTAQLRKMGHPFGRGQSTKRPQRGIRRGAVRPLPINVQSGALRRSIFTRRARGSRFRSVGVGVSVPYARYVLSPVGTRKMVARGFQKEITKRWRARLKATRDWFSTRASQDWFR